MRRLLLAAMAVGTTALVRDAHSQPRAAGPGGVRLEARAEAIAARRASFAFGAGASLPASNYARVALWGSGGPLLGGNGTSDGDVSSTVLRAEGVVRFLLDPFAERKRGFYASAGIGSRFMRHTESAQYLVLLLGFEGRRRRAWVPALELGLGDGARAGVVLRQARRGYR